MIVVQRRPGTKRIPVAERSAVGYESFGMRIPDRMAIKIDEYIQAGGPLGGFLTAVFENNFVDACCKADPENRAILLAYAHYVYNEAPAPCWGSPDKMEAWWAQFEPSHAEGRA